MRTRTLRTAFVSLITVAVVAVGASAFAGKGMGDNDGDGGYGHHRWNDDRPYCYQNPNLTSKQREQLDNERQAFFAATQDTRQEIYAKRLALRAELAKKDPDPKAAADLQKQISSLRTDLDQKRIEHQLAMRKIAPDAGRGFYGMGHRSRHGGYGRGMHDGRGYGMGYGPGYCRQ